MRNAVCYVATAEPFGVLRRFVQPLSSASPMWRSAAWKGKPTVRDKAGYVIGVVSWLVGSLLSIHRLFIVLAFVSIP
jgi:hypothetical protein